MNRWLRLSLRALLLLTPCLAAEAAGPSVVINEIHFAPADKRPLEFIELHNAGAADINLSGWALERFSFPKDVIVPKGGFVVVAQDPGAFAAEYGFQPLGPLPGNLSNRGETLSLRNPAGQVIDQVHYGVGFPWPTAAQGAGSSLERVHPALPSQAPGSWRSAGYPVVADTARPTVFVPAQDSHWRWRKGTNEASQPLAAWRQVAFRENETWQEGRTSIGYGDDDDATVLSDMQGHYTSIFLRHSFAVSDRIPAALLLRVRVDDGCIAWINGREVGRFHLPAGELSFAVLAQSHEATEDFEEVLISRLDQLDLAGTNVLALQVFNASPNSSDLTIDAELRSPAGPGRSRRPTPGATNSVFSLSFPPSIQEVSHRPTQPKSGQAVTVTARIGSADQMEKAELHLQVVEPGAYVRKTDPSFNTNWLSFPLHDDGQNGDAQAGDGLFSATIPGTFQQHRRLIRYQIDALARNGASIRVPYRDDPSPNFAWFVYDGLPEWTGASQPGRTPAVTYSAQFLGTMPAYHLLAREEDVARSQWDGNANRKRFFGTLVYEGHVYDHMQFHNRGSGSAYISGKNKWGFKFNPGHEFSARDNNGRLYKNTWDSLNLNPGLSTPYLPVHCGIAGLDEAVSFRAFQLAGVPAANTHWVQFRIIDSAAESTPDNQYAGDLRGLYLVVQDMDGAWLRERDLPDGDIYSIQSGRKHSARDRPRDESGWNQFLNGVRSEHPEAWWRTNLDLTAYYSFHAINRVIGNVDLRPDGNHGYYRRPDGRWAPFPWDHDMVLVPRVHQPGFIDAIRSLNVGPLKLEFQNRAREILDLFCADPNPDGGQIGQLVDELGQVLIPKGFTNDWGQLDAAVWNWNPHLNQKGLFYLNPAAGQHFGGTWERTLASADLAGFCRYIVEFCTDSRPTKNYAPNDGDQRGYGFGFLQHEAKDDTIPVTPILRSIGGPDWANLSFEVSAFESPRTNGFAAVQWRVGEISAPGQAGWSLGQPRRYEIEPHWLSAANPLPTRSFQPPKAVCVSNHTYRVRARYCDQTGRWSHWSAPVQFVARTMPHPD